MSKAERLMEMMITINAKRDFTLGELADEFGVSKRTVLRDMQSLEKLGFPLYSEVGAAGGYHLLKERVLPPVLFTESEAKAVFFACQSLKYYCDLPFEQETSSALKKFLGCLPADIQHSIANMQNKIVFWTPDRHRSTPLLKDLFRAIMSDRALTIRYSSKYKESVRTIVPVGLYSMNGLWYCPAYCLTSKSIREFRADRVVEIVSTQELSNKNWHLPDTIHDYLNQLQVSTDCHIIIELTEIGVKYCETEFLLAKGLEILETGGRIDMRVPQATLDWIADYLLPLGKEASVLEPTELKEMVRTKIRELYAHYCE